MIERFIWLSAECWVLCGRYTVAVVRIYQLNARWDRSVSQSCHPHRSTASTLTATGEQRNLLAPARCLFLSTQRAEIARYGLSLWVYQTISTCTPLFSRIWHLCTMVSHLVCSVREYVFYVFFQISKKHDLLRFFWNDGSKKRKN